MAAVEVGRLRLRCDPARGAAARFALEDALRTTLPDDERLVLLRRMRVTGGARTGAPDAVRAGWLSAVADARHGGEDGAGAANCVWFASRAEAERVLLARLLAGRPVDAWFWKLAMPRWRGLPLRDWLRASLGEALAERDDRRVLAIAQCCVEAGASAMLVGILEPAGTRATGPPMLPRPGAPDLPSASSGIATADEDASAAMPSVSPITLSPPLCALLVALKRGSGEARAVARAVLRAAALRASPALALSMPTLDRIVAATLAAIEGRAAPGPAPRQDPDRAARLTLPPVRAELRPAPAAEAARTRPDGGQPRPAEALRPDTAPPASPATDAAAQAEESPHGVPLRSRHAGLWLAVPGLVALGFREWLAERPALLGDDPGRRLLRAIARHHRVPPDDPALSMLGPDDETTPGWADLWRHGLDRWLRSTARRRLHDLVNRPGTIELGELRLDLRFPLAAADLRLRRLALDRDPGWTDWLGLAIRFHFSDDPRLP